MAQVKKIRSRGANIVVEANGEVLFAPGTELSRWKNRFSQRVRSATEIAAPTNKRPRWGHYGKPLKATITAATQTRITKGGGFFYIAVGSRAPHSYYVDQGTGIYAGRGPYEAAVLPPFVRGGASLYERTWRPGGPPNPRVSPVMIRGQKPQNFFDTGLKNGFRSMRLRSFQVPGEGASGISSAMKTAATGMADFLGNTPPDLGFRASLEEWRRWRDTAFNAGFKAGRRQEPRTRASRARGGQGTTYRKRRTSAEDERRAAQSRLRSQRRRDALSDRKKERAEQNRKANAVAFEARSRAERKRFLAVLRKKGSIVAGSVHFEDGRWTAEVFIKGAGGIKRAVKFKGAVVK